MSEKKLIEVAKWLNSKGYHIEFETDELWMEDELTEHRFRDLCEMLDEYANHRIRVVVREAVEEMKTRYDTIALEEWDRGYNSGVVECIGTLTHTESKLNES